MRGLDLEQSLPLYGSAAQRDNEPDRPRPATCPPQNNTHYEIVSLVYCLTTIDVAGVRYDGVYQDRLSIPIQHTSQFEQSALSLHALPFIVRRASTIPPLGVITSGHDPVPAAQP